ncbi:hypothetical protein [Yellowstone lake phycodnavirus 3]|uniref:hypothetical protein n=1 Tax=Yellowstone lake phycodnavirus 3 TaxID=1586715 RepID=UPI0006EB88F0|nr:hypothetical protein AR677_gp020 [Yellowstone lake phycodnavirus 3]BAT22519.1 hypothetical protein [Yellowstone lake phycodnavirus 3]
MTHIFFGPCEEVVLDEPVAYDRHVLDRIPHDVLVERRLRRAEPLVRLENELDKLGIARTDPDVIGSGVIANLHPGVEEFLGVHILPVLWMKIRIKIVRLLRIVREVVIVGVTRILVVDTHCTCLIDVPIL